MEQYEKTLYKDKSVRIVGIYRDPAFTDLITIEHRYKDTQERHRDLIEERRDEAMSYKDR